ncbi:hypothetical protein [Desulfovibrio cuneatus]|uniref:hypothetical protein n=1 Tax=Desulfovibrio cuneatus TaxID=159728 RepID=UPI000421116D|nr:hypothetical protein [Desulfovibrio cuneatus]
MTKVIDTCSILVLTALICFAANMVGYKGELQTSLLGVGVILAIGVLGFGISQLPLLNKTYTIIWVSLLAIFASSPLCPWSGWIVATTSKIQFMAVATPLLAYAGLAVGKDLAMFKKLSWRIIPVALAVCAGTFLFAAIIAHFALKWEGAI